MSHVLPMAVAAILSAVAASLVIASLATTSWLVGCITDLDKARSAALAFSNTQGDSYQSSNVYSSYYSSHDVPGIVKRDLSDFDQNPITDMNFCMQYGIFRYSFTIMGNTIVSSRITKLATTALLYAITGIISIIVYFCAIVSTIHYMMTGSEKIYTADGAAIRLVKFLSIPALLSILGMAAFSADAGSAQQNRYVIEMFDGSLAFGYSYYLGWASSVACFLALFSAIFAKVNA